MICRNCLFLKGGVNISKKIKFTLILALILFLSINVISANEINDNNLNSIDSSNSIELDSIDNTNDLSSDLNQNQNNDDYLKSDNEQSDLTDSSDNDDTSAVETIDNVENLENTADEAETDTDAMGSETTAGDLNVASENDSANLESTKEKTSITVSKTSILRGTSIYIYLKDSQGNPIAGKNLILTINKVNYTKTTNNKGAVSLKFNALLGNYTLKVKFNGDSNYSSKSHSFALHIYRLKTNVTVAKETVIRGKYLYAYLKDKNGNPLAEKKLIIKFRGKNYIKTTNSKGRVSLKITPVAGKYLTKITFSGTKSYYKSSISFTLKVTKQATKITIANTSVIRGKYLYAYLKTSDGKALKSKRVIIKFDNSYFYKTTNKNGRVALKIKTKLGTFPTRVIYEGSAYYKASSKSFKLKSYVAKTKIVSKKSVVRGKYFYVYLKDSSNNPVSKEKVVITFGSSKYTKTTNAQGRVALKINAAPKNYSVKIKYAGSNSYKASSKSFNLTVLNNVTAKIIAKSQTCLGEYSIRLVDLNGNPLANQTITVIASTFNHSAGSGKKITVKTIIIDSDHINGQAKDIKYMQSLATALRAKGYKVIVSGWGPNAHCDDIKGKYKNACVLCLFGGADSGMFVDMSSDWYQNLLKKYGNRVVLGFTVPPNYVDLATCSYLKRAHDDDYSVSSFKGLAYPGTYLNDHGMDYIYGRTVSEMANNFVNYAVKGLSIGLNNTVPQAKYTYSLKTNDNGYATLSSLPSGNYTVKISYSNTALGYVAETVKTKVQIL